ncbi:MAG: BatA domain-containing protein [Cytophagales bacterium]|nr:BatA domain-containing protein [Cytophagales bacterium]
MQFANPGALWWLLALAIPLIIHLFNFRRTRKVFFTNVAFLKKVETETSSFRKLKQWLIMAARMLFIAALVLAFAQPFLPARNAESTGDSGMNSLYLDNSLSMQNTTENKRYIDLAAVKLDELLSLFKNQQNVQFVTNTFSGEDQFVKGAAKIKERLTEVGFSSRNRTLEQIYQRQINLATKESGQGRNSLFWFSDFQKSTAGNLSDISPDSSQHIYLVPVQGEVLKNVFVDSVWLASPFVREMQNSVLYVEVFNSGNEPIENLPIKLFIDDEQTSTSSVSIAPESSAKASFNFTVREKGEHKGMVQFDDQPITFDNESYFVLNISPAINILHIYEEKSPSNYVEKLFSNDSLFNFSAYSSRNVNTNRIEENDLVILEGLRSFNSDISQKVSAFVSGGGSVLVIPSSSPDILSYRELVAGLGLSDLKGTMDSLSGNNQIALNEPDKSNPFFADVFERANFDALQNLPRTQAVLDWAGLGNRLLTLRSGKNFLSQSKFSNGLFYLLASPLDTKFGNFPEHALFVPTFFKIAASSVKGERLAYNFSEGSITLAFPGAPKNAIYTLKNERTELIPVQRMQGNNLILELPDASELGADIESGFFELQIDGVTKKTIALNHNSDESKMGQYSVEELQEAFADHPNITVFDNILDGDFVSTFSNNNFGKKRWKYFIYAALLFLLVEILLVRFMKS